jgi:hypothetical protein
MTDERDPTTTIIIRWLVSISDGVAFDKRRGGNVYEELLAVARAVRDIGRREWAEKIENAAEAMRPDWDGRPDDIITGLTNDLNADMRANWLEQHRLGGDDVPG